MVDNTMKQEDIPALAERILKYLKTQRANGIFTPENPAKAQDLIEAAKGAGIKITDIDVRYAIHSLRERGEPIGTYFYAWHISELNEVEEDLTRRAMSMLRARSGIRRWKRREQMKKVLQVELELVKVTPPSVKT
jgi:hypothetical protein